MGNTQSRNLNKVLGGVGLTCLLIYVYRKNHSSPKIVTNTGSEEVPQTNGDRRKRNDIGINKKFWEELKVLLRVAVPGVFSMEAAYLIIVAGAMIARTYCDLWMLKNGTSIERAIIGRNEKDFKRELSKFLMVMLPVAMVNNTLKYGLNEISLRFRTRITNYLLRQYIVDYTYYKISNLDNRIDNVDQLLTEDVEKFCTSLSELYSNISKPILDIVIYARKLTGAIGIQAPSMMLGYLLVSGLILTRLRKPMARLTVGQQQLEGRYRYVNSRIITHSEEIAFYNGNKMEHTIVEQSFAKLFNHVLKTNRFQFLIGIFDSLVTKYIATIVGYFVISIPFFNLAYEPFKEKSQDELMQHYYSSGRMLMNLAMAVGRLVLAGRGLTRLAGYTQRVVKLKEVLHDINNGNYVRTMATEGNDEEEGEMQLTNLEPNSGKIILRDNIIKFEKVPLVTPNGVVLVDSLDFEVTSGMNVLVCGPNGCGKSSLFRVLSGLWPTFGGTITKPAPEELFYVPQTSYLTIGTLRDQVIYPHTHEQYLASGKTDKELFKFLQEVRLDYILEREEEGWETVRVWTDVLSGGEKQRISMARIFYHDPQFAILDECTSAVDIETEGFMYRRCRELNISLFTITHRKSVLSQWHEYVLEFDDEFNYSFYSIQD
eukprot:TRINITY_DN1888_c0_g1_i14.p1 TRINITY_DN1888_c0_g1~~TRINITY_DN1888_c0_g1_i14.p1  ORF type:complete len:656 (+),score=122.47 TRINITY_DN1888_c0_g1_i14:13-1980(+)